MGGGAAFLLLVLAVALALFVRDRHVRGWRRPLFRKRGYDVTAAGRAYGRLDGTAPRGDVSGGGGGGGSGF